MPNIIQLLTFTHYQNINHIFNQSPENYLIIVHSDDDTKIKNYLKNFFQNMAKNIKNYPKSDMYLLKIQISHRPKTKAYSKITL